MFSLDQLVENVAACQMGRMSLDDFEDWFRSNSHGAYQDPVLSEAFFAVEEVFSTELHGMKGEQVFEELGRAVRPFALGPVYSPARADFWPARNDNQQRRTTSARLMRSSTA